MLQPTNRLTLIDAMRPPAGFRLDSAMAVTFTLDLRALLAAPAAFALTGPNGIEPGESSLEPIELLHAVRSYSDKITVFSQVGEIALPPSRRVFAFLERSVVPVRAPRHGVVHPKVWVLRYEPATPTSDADRDGGCRLRVLVASRNLTFDASWDTVVRLDQTTTEPGADLAGVADMFVGLLEHADDALVERHRDRVRSLSDDLRAARFALPAGVDDLRVHVLGLTGVPSPLPIRAERSLIVSPFVSNDFFTSVRPAKVDELVSRPEALDDLDSTTLGQIGSVYAFDDGSAPDHTRVEDHWSTEDPGRPLVGLHAKVFAFESDGRARLFLGSANATGAAFGANVEILLEFTGSVDALGIDRLCDGSDDEPGLRALLATYTGPADPEAGLGDSSLDAVRRRMARLAIDGTVEESGSGWAVTYRSDEPVAAVPDAEVFCWPLASPGNRRKVVTDVPFEARFETTLETMSGFLAFEVAATDRTITQFVVPVPLAGVPEHRDRALLRALVGNAERFFRYLLALLNEDPGHMKLLDVVERLGTEGNGRDLTTLPVLEQLLRTMRCDPAKLAGLHPLVSDLAADDALPYGFAELWKTIYDVGVVGAGS